MNIYTDPMCAALGVRPITDFFPDFNFNSEVPEDATSSIPSGELHPRYGKKHSKEILQKMRQPRSEQGRRNIAIGVKKWNKEVGKSQEHRDKLGAAHRGVKRSQETCEKNRELALKKKPCPHCGQQMNAGNLSRHIKIRHNLDK